MSGTLPIGAQRGQKTGRRALVCAALLSWPTAASAADGVSVDCPALSAEQAAEVEARVRASLLSAELECTARLVCAPGQAHVEVEANGKSTSFDVATSDANLQEELLQAVETVLRDLAHPPPSPEPVTAPAAAPAEVEAKPPPAPAPRAEPSPQRTSGTTPGSAKPTPASLQLLLQGMLESWSGRPAFGGGLGAAYAAGQFWYGAKLAVLRPITNSAAFTATEWHAAVRAGVQPTWGLGWQASLGIGPSLLALAPRGDAATFSSTVVVSWFVDAALSRPIWFGKLALSPSIGARFFMSERGVRVDSQERLILRGVNPQLSLSAVYRFE
jgi:hypothetical protein